MMSLRRLSVASRAHGFCNAVAPPPRPISRSTNEKDAAGALLDVPVAAPPLSCRAGPARSRAWFPDERSRAGQESPLAQPTRYASSLRDDSGGDRVSPEPPRQRWAPHVQDRGKDARKQANHKLRVKQLGEVEAVRGELMPAHCRGLCRFAACRARRAGGHPELGPGCPGGLEPAPVRRRKRPQRTGGTLCKGGNVRAGEQGIAEVVVRAVSMGKWEGGHGHGHSHS